MVGKVIAGVYLGFITMLLDLPIYVRYPRLIKLKVFFALYMVFFYSLGKREQEIKATGRPISELTSGQTPFRVLALALEAIPDMASRKMFVDLGSGSGHLVFFVREKYGIEAFGFEVMPTLVKLAQWEAKKSPKVTFRHGDFLTEFLPPADVFFMAGTCFNGLTQSRSIEVLSGIQKESYVITVSWPLDHPHFRLLKTWNVLFSWGFGHLYLQKKVV